jgi:hypothetical protein
VFATDGWLDNAQPLAPKPICLAPQLLYEAVHNEDDARAPGGVEAAGPEAAALLGELLERQRLVRGR